MYMWYIPEQILVRSRFDLKAMKPWENIDLSLTDFQV
jgi:hypothetical protein